MTQLATSQPDPAEGRYPLSYTQEYFCTLDEGDRRGTFGNRFHPVTGLRVAGHVDVPTLQGALDDVVERHELLRTVVVDSVLVIARAAQRPPQASGPHQAVLRVQLHCRRRRDSDRGQVRSRDAQFHVHGLAGGLRCVRLTRWLAGPTRAPARSRRAATSRSS